MEKEIRMQLIWISNLFLKGNLSEYEYVGGPAYLKMQAFIFVLPDQEQ